jgi:hypothetical protein
MAVPAPLLRICHKIPAFPSDLLVSWRVAGIVIIGAPRLGRVSLNRDDVLGSELDARPCSNLIRVVRIVVEKANVTVRPDRLHSNPHSFDELMVAVRKTKNQFGEISSAQALAVVCGGDAKGLRKFRLCVNGTVERILHPHIFAALSEFNLVGSNHLDRSYSLCANQLNGNAVSVVFFKQESKICLAFRWARIFHYVSNLSFSLRSHESQPR